jgi:catechol 2,3-dioxygenase-like lactoylglutathione lyase family enzyme
MIFVKDLPRMTSFYGDILGLERLEETRTESWAEFEAGGGVILALHRIPPPLADQIEIASTPRPREMNPVKLIFEVEDLESERRRLEHLGVTIIERPWGACDGIDPEGNIFQVIPKPKIQ